MTPCEPCKNLHRRVHRREALWMVRGVPYCNACYEHLLELDTTIEIEEIRRLSDEERPFEIYKKNYSHHVL
jgi:hypothetical protein